ncbi:SAP domain-containing protein [Bacillus thuringiensis]|uniref:SAP domain-containing protein n=1 Tax=Bacillus thuringiensis TaxID=1428 RepID=UPI0021D67ADC|nr:SAP domain-containing protein [Bacillus thuringiensis]MCU7667496.1 SAP domain-containing protein [Bacillus thuringiensis]
MRPILTKEISIQDFKDFYWLKEELQSFCREHGISASGSKIEISDRIETFLRTGEIKKPQRHSKATNKPQTNNELSLDTVIAENHRCGQDVRAFFKEVIPKFHFSTYIQNYFKNNVGKTYRDVVDAWNEEEKRKKDPSYQKKIAPQFEYNQFIRDFFSDSKNKGKNREEAIEAWNKIKKLPGSNKYIPED